MIDNIRFNFLFNPDGNWIIELEKNINLKKQWSNKKGTAYKGKLYLDNSSKTLSNGKSKPSLLIEIKTFADGGTRVFVKNSLRKWFFGNQTVGEFNKKTFEECLLLLSEKLLISPEILFASKVTRAEYGANLTFRPEFRYFYACIFEHFDLKKKCTYGEETIEFKGENRSVIFYDKVAEQTGKSFLTRNKKKLDEQIFVLRYEIKVNKMSGPHREKPLMEYLHGIIKNWDEIADLWYKELDKITFVNSMNSKVYNYLKDAKIKPVKDYLVYLGMQSLGLETWRLIFSDRMYAKIRKSAMDSQLQIYDEFNSMVQEEDFGKLFKEKVREKAKKLKA